MLIAAFRFIFVYNVSHNLVTIYFPLQIWIVTNFTVKQTNVHYSIYVYIIEKFFKKTQYIVIFLLTTHKLFVIISPVD